jgi:uncharacterized protein (TIGR02611 family)
VGGPANTDSDQTSTSRRRSHPILRRAGAWRERIRSRPATRLAWKVVTGLVGTAVTVTGLILVPFPGPGWLIVILGLFILASEFAWAQRLLHVVRGQVRAWTQWVGRQSLPVRTGIGVLTVVFVAGLLYGMALVFGVPSFVPDALVPPLPGL